MFLLKLITILGVAITFTETPEIDCGHKFVNGCYSPRNNAIYLNYQSDNINRTLYHELGHRIFWRNKQAQTIIKHYPPLTPAHREIYTWYILNHQENPDIILEERTANYFAEFMLNNAEFSIKYPCLYIYFRDKLNTILGHSIFDEQVETIIKDYPSLKNYIQEPLDYRYKNKTYQTIALQERLTDYLIQYIINNKEFSIKHPCLWVYFNQQTK